MSNGAANCLLEVCCPTAEAQAKMSKKLMAETGVSKEYADKCAEWIYTHFDLAERGTLKPFKESIAKLARENP
jgi:hypothetical protein